MTKFIQDLRYTTRIFLKSPGFVAIAVLTLALGIGSNTALFSVINGVLLNPLPYPRSEQLVAVYGDAPGFSRHRRLLFPTFMQRVVAVYRVLTQVFEHLRGNLRRRHERRPAGGLYIAESFTFEP
jgi:hypothetical protein